jgi:2-polyprenyl-3-methyl-5-hydroxy-6-metoxy-1,4-benzoquinol methylase
LITKEEVTLAYRLILGREPENADVVENYSHTVHSLKDLRNEFLKSPEFVSQMAEALQNPQFVRQRHPFNLPKIPVEAKVADDVLAQMFKRTADAWEHLGFTEPYWSVLTQPQYTVERFSQNSDQFYESGGPLFRTFLATLKRNGYNPTDLHTCLEVGCGVGRMTGYLAETFSKVIAADVSGQHLVMAKNYLTSQNISNVELMHWQSLQQVHQLPQVDVVLSVITLQHNPPPIMAWLLAQLLNSLKPGGVAFVQLPTYRNGYMFEAERYLHTPQENKIEMHFLPQADVFEVIETANCRCLEIREDGMVGEEDKMLSNSFLIQKK